MSETKLKPCPWCGAKSRICNSSLGYFVECIPLGHLHNSGVLNDKFYKTSQEATKAWNRRIENE